MSRRTYDIEVVWGKYRTFFIGKTTRGEDWLFENLKINKFEAILGVSVDAEFGSAVVDEMEKYKLRLKHRNRSP